MYHSPLFTNKTLFKSSCVTLNLRGLYNFGIYLRGAGNPAATGKHVVKMVMNGKVVMYDMKKGQPIKRAGQVHEIPNLPLTRKNPFLNPDRKRLKVAEVSQAKMALEEALSSANQGSASRRPYSQLNSQYERLQLEMAKAAEAVRMREQENKEKREKRKHEQLMEDMKLRLEKQEHRKKYLKQKAFYPKFLPND